jgi:hypothetical protein
MANPSGAKGSKFERDVVDYLRKAGFDVERLARKGKDDEGDVVVKDGAVHVLELKAEKAIDLSGYLREAKVEAENYAKHRNLPAASINKAAVIKRRNHGIAQAYVVMTLADYFNIKD